MKSYSVFSPRSFRESFISYGIISIVGLIYGLVYTILKINGIEYPFLTGAIVIIGAINGLYFASRVMARQHRITHSTKEEFEFIGEMNNARTVQKILLIYYPEARVSASVNRVIIKNIPSPSQNVLIANH